MAIAAAELPLFDLNQPGPRYNIEADWTLMTTCNFRCAYCFHPPDKLGAKIRPPASPNALARFFDDSGLTWHLHLTGGEPFHYPEFLDLCRLLTGKHLISINTNADSPKTLQFARVVSPDAVLFINCAVHLAQRLERNRIEAFVEHVHALKSAGFDAFVSSVMYPEVFPHFVERWEWFAGQGLPLWPKVFRGAYRGQRYPESYTPVEREIIVDYSRRAETLDADRMTLRVERPTVDPVLDRTLFLHGVRSYRGTLCLAGRDVVTIDHRGDIFRCAGQGKLGNVVTGQFERAAAAAPCASTFCPYYCEKYSAVGAVQKTPVEPLAAR